MSLTRYVIGWYVWKTPISTIPYLVFLCNGELLDIMTGFKMFGWLHPLLKHSFTYVTFYTSHGMSTSHGKLQDVNWSPIEGTLHFCFVFPSIGVKYVLVTIIYIKYVIRA